MFTIRRGKFEYYSEDGSFVTLAEWEVIKWYPHYVTASQQMMKLGERESETISSLDVLQEVLRGMHGLAPELVVFASGKEPEFLKKISEIRELAVLRGGLLEHKEQITQLQHALEAARKRETLLMAEGQRLVEVTADYERVVKELSP